MRLEIYLKSLESHPAVCWFRNQEAHRQFYGRADIPEYRVLLGACAVRPTVVLSHPLVRRRKLHPMQENCFRFTVAILDNLYLVARTEAGFIITIWAD